MPSSNVTLAFYKAGASHALRPIAIQTPTMMLEKYASTCTLSTVALSTTGTVLSCVRSSSFVWVHAEIRAGYSFSLLETVAWETVV